MQEINSLNIPRMQTVRLLFSRPLSRLSGQNRLDDHENEEEGGL